MTAVGTAPILYLVTDDDVELGERLVAEGGWYSISNRYHRVARFKTGQPATGRDLVRPELWHTPAGRKLIELWDGQWARARLRLGGPDIEERTLTPGQYAAFRKAGGQPA